MLVELRVADLGIVDDLTLLVGTGLTAITGETGAGKTLLVEAVELLLGGRADASLVREGATEARVEGRFVDADGQERVLARVAARRRAGACLRGRTARDRGGARGASVRRSWTCTGRTRTSRCSRPPSSAPRSTGSPARRRSEALDALRAARADVRAAVLELDSLGGDARARARELDLLRFQIGEIEQAGLDDPGEDVALEAEEALLARRRRAPGRARRRRTTRSRTAGYDAVGVAASALADRRPFVDLSNRLRSVLAELGDLESELRLAAERVPDDPERLETVRVRRQLLRELQRKYGDTLAEVLAFAGRGPRPPDRARGLRGPRGRARGGANPGRGGDRRRGRGCRRPAGRPPARSVRR